MSALYNFIFAKRVYAISFATNLINLILLTCLTLLSLSCHQPQNINLVHNQQSTYNIVLPKNPDTLLQKAAAEIQYYINKVSGVSIPVVHNLVNKKQHIYIGVSPLNDQRKKQITQLSEDAFLLFTENENLYIAANNSKAILYATYTFIDEYLGCKLLTPTEEFIPEKPSIRLSPIDKVYQPDFAFRRLLTPGRFDEKFQHWHKLEELDDWGMFVHTFQSLLSPQQYFDDHPEYFSLVNGRRLQDGQLCLSNPEVIETLTENLRIRMAEKPDKTYWSVSQNDAIQYCECKNCKLLYKKYGNISGAYVQMSNDIARAFPDKQISTLAYQFTRSAPKNITPAPNVNIMFCSIECNRSMPLKEDPRSADFVQDLKDWSALTNNIFVWDYVVQFKNYLTPFPNFHTLQPNLQLFKEYDIPMMFEQGSNGSWSDFIELKQYLIAKLLWDTDIEVTTCIQEFINMYYGPAAPHIQAYFDLSHQAIADKATSEHLDIYGFPQNYTDSYLHPDLLSQYMVLLDKAEAAVSNEPEYLLRVQRTRLPFDFSYLDIALNGGFESPSFFTKVGQQKQIDSNMLERLDRLVEHSLKAGASHINERSFKTPAYAKYVKAKLNRMKQINLLKSAKITSTTPHSETYPVGGPKALTDGLLGGLDFHFNWLGFQGEDMQINIEFNTVQQLTHVNMHFLKAVNSWVFLPVSVTIETSSDGINYTALASQKGDIEDRHFLIKSIPFDFQLEPTKTKYLRIKADNMQKCPKWHRGYGEPSWIFIDEIIVK